MPGPGRGQAGARPGPGPSSEVQTDFTDNLPPQNVAEDMLLNLLVAEIRRLDAGDDLLAEPLYAARPVDHRVGVGDRGIAHVEHVLPIRLVGIAHREVAQISPVVGREA